MKAQPVVLEKGVENMENDVEESVEKPEDEDKEEEEAENDQIMERR